MRKLILTGIGIGLLGLTAAVVQAEETSVKQIMKELDQVNSAPSVTAPAKPPAETPVEKLLPVDIDGLLQESRDEYVAGDYEAARAGFEAALKQEPGNSIARYYRDRLIALDRRNAEEAAIEQVDEAWGERILRDYPATADLRRMLNLGETQESVDVSGGFPELDFPEGTYALYRPQLSRIFVLNTPSEIQKLEALLTSLGSRSADSGAQIEIEARFVEFSEGTLEELGFIWAKDQTEDLHLGGDWNIPAGEDLFADSLRTVPFSKTGNLGLGEAQSPASKGWRAGRIEDAFSDNAGSVSFFGELDSDNGDSVDLLIRALDQTSGADVLSAPRIVTVSGNEAVIQVGERHFYPEIYESGVSAGTVLHVRYEDFYEKLLGVELKVTPTITGDEIGLELNPKIIDLIGWERFELAPADTSYTYYQYRIGQQFDHEPVIAKLPVFKEREVKTEVVVQDGATVGMGGLISEKLESFDDRVPVLGSLPLVGRLFRSEGERLVKRNLMIFVTARKVQNNGAMVASRSFE